MLRASCRRRREGGFSLAELLIVMAIIGILALAAAPWFAKISQRNQVKSAGSQLAITLQAARMRAVKRNLPARVAVSRATGTQSYNLIETFEQTIPTPIKVAELRLPALVDFPPSPPNPYPVQPAVILFGPDGRATQPGTFTLRGVIGSGTTNDLPVQVSGNGKIEVLGPNPTVVKPRGTAWH
jgi:type II secretion system protein H